MSTPPDIKFGKSRLVSCCTFLKLSGGAHHQAECVCPVVESPLMKRMILVHTSLGMDCEGLDLYLSSVYAFARSSGAGFVVDLDH